MSTQTLQTLLGVAVSYGREFYANEIKSGVLLREFDQRLDDWQVLSDRARPVIWSAIGPVIVLIGIVVVTCALWIARVLGQAWGYWLREANARCLMEVIAGDGVHIAARVRNVLRVIYGYTARTIVLSLAVLRLIAIVGYRSAGKLANQAIGVALCVSW